MEFSFFEDSHSHTMESQLQTQSQLETEIQKKTRKLNYSQDEDEALVKAWLHVTGDAVVGRDQKMTRLWMRILETFHEILGRITERDAQGLQNRWQTISRDVSKFCGYFNKIGRINPSGWSEQMILDEAKQQYGEIEGLLQPRPVPFLKFKFEHCWKLLKDTSKWNDHVLMRNTVKGGKQTSKSQSQAISLDDLGSPPRSTTSTSGSIPFDEFMTQDHDHNLYRPPEGRKKAKATKKREAKDEESTMLLKSINESVALAAKIELEKWEAKKNSEKEKWEAKKNSEKEKLEFKRRRIEQKQLHQEMKVMSQSLVGLSPEQAAYWKLRQSQIVEGYKANGLMSNLQADDSSFDFGF